MLPGKIVRLVSGATVDQPEYRFKIDAYTPETFPVAARKKPMTTEEAIIERLKPLPDVARREVLDFAEFLAARTQEHEARAEETQWSDMSLNSAMRGMEDEPEIYTRTDLADLKESFR